jgi:hypothetical protein
MPLQRRIPKRGFKNFNRVEYQVVNVRDLGRIDGGEVTPETLRDHGLTRNPTMPVKILGMGEVERAYQVSAHAFSETAREKIEAAGGSVSVLSGRRGGDQDEASDPEVRAEAAPASEHVEATAPEENGASEAEEEQA